MKVREHLEQIYAKLNELTKHNQELQQKLAGHEQRLAALEKEEADLDLDIDIDTTLSHYQENAEGETEENSNKVKRSRRPNTRSRSRRKRRRAPSTRLTVGEFLTRLEKIHPGQYKFFVRTYQDSPDAIRLICGTDGISVTAFMFKKDSPTVVEHPVSIDNYKKMMIPAAVPNWLNDVVKTAVQVVNMDIPEITDVGKAVSEAWSLKRYYLHRLGAQILGQERFGALSTPELRKRLYEVGLEDTK